MNHFWYICSYTTLVVVGILSCSVGVHYSPTVAMILWALHVHRDFSRVISLSFLFPYVFMRSLPGQAPCSITGFSWLLHTSILPLMSHGENDFNSKIFNSHSSNDHFDLNRSMKELSTILIASDFAVMPHELCVNSPGYKVDTHKDLYVAGKL